MDTLDAKLNGGSKDTAQFLNHVFNFNEDNKELMMNIIQYSFIAIVPIVCILKIIKNYFPEEDDAKGTVTILTEVIGQILFILTAIWFIHRIIIFIPTYSGKQYEEINFHNMLLPFLFIVLTMQTKLGAKINILSNRLMNRAGFKNNKEEDDNTDTNHQGSRADFLNANTVMPNSGQAQPAPDFNQMYGGPTTPLQNANTPAPVAPVQQMPPMEPMAANGALGGAFGSAF